MKYALPLLLVISSCASHQKHTEQELFFNEISKHCGKAYEGKVVADTSPSPDFSGKMYMHVRECSDEQIKIPFHIGENRSRTWIITKKRSGLSLKHDHRHKDGTPDRYNMYGGETDSDGTKETQSFPTDKYSRLMFYEQKLIPSLDNVWKIHINDKTFSYQLTRKNSDRNFKVDFDLTKPIKAPPAPWGHEK